MARTVSIGTQDFEKMIQRNCFYVDKTGFIKEWWESEDEVTLITRPRPVSYTHLDVYKRQGRNELSWLMYKEKT